MRLYPLPTNIPQHSPTGRDAQREQTVRNMPVKDNPGILPINLYGPTVPTGHLVDFSIVVGVCPHTCEHTFESADLICINISREVRNGKEVLLNGGNQTLIPKKKIKYYYY